MSQHATLPLSPWLRGRIARLFLLLALVLALSFLGSEARSAGSQAASRAQSAASGPAREAGQPAKGQASSKTAKSPKTADAKAAKTADAKAAKTADAKAAKAADVKSAKAAKADKAGKAGSDKAKASRGGSAQGGKAIHSQPWAFYGGRSAAQWGASGVDGKTLQRQAAPGSKGNRPREEAKSSKPWSGSGLDLNVVKETQSWRGNEDGQGGGESVPLESQHRVQAFAKVQDEDFSLGVGPEVIVKDSQKNSYLTHSEQPDMEAGVGMHFKFDF